METLNRFVISDEIVKMKMISKNKTIRQVFCLSFLLLAGLKLNAQITSPSCGSHELIKSLDRKNHGFLDLTNQYMRQITDLVRLQSQNRNYEDLYVIPVVFHVVYNNDDENIPDSVFHNQIEILNDCFRRHNADTVNTRPQFYDIVGDAKIEFKLAEIDEDGFPTTGITRTYTDVEYFGGVLPYAAWQTQEITGWVSDSLLYNYFRLTKSASGGIDAWDTEQYLNIWIGDLRILEPQINNFEELVYFGLATPPLNHANWPDSIIAGVDTLGHGILIHYVNIGRK